MTLDEFLRTLETLIDDRETDDDDPGEGNFGCEDCRKCNHCRFCIGCDSCTDCTYCEESIDCTSCTQSKRCVSCEKVSYCEDCRDCKASRYLTLCVDCRDCVHCLGCVGLEGAEFYVLNQKRTRKEYFALLRQVQELMQDRMEAGWRPAAIGLASEIDDPIAAGHDLELSAAPWLEQLRPEPEPAAPERFASEPVRGFARDEYEYRERGYEDRGRERPGRASLEPRWREGASEPERGRRDPVSGSRRAAPVQPHASDPYASDPYASDPPDYEVEPPRRAREPRQHEREEPDERRPPPRSRSFEEPNSREPERGRRRDAGLEREVRERWDRQPRRRESDYEAPIGRRAEPDPRALGRREPERYEDDWDDRPISREVGWEDSRERTVARPRRDPELREPAAPVEDDPLLDGAPLEREHEPSSPWLDEEAQARRRAKRGTLRRAGRPKRKPDAEPAPESTGSASYRTGSAPARGEGTQTGTSTGLRLGRKPKR
ncbi:MAG: hypothetical protein R6X02_11565 [Enhygromyxa sp.]